MMHTISFFLHSVFMAFFEKLFLSLYFCLSDTPSWSIFHTLSFPPSFLVSFSLFLLLTLSDRHLSLSLTRVGDDQHNTVGAVLDNVGDDELEDVDIPLHQVQTALALLLTSSSGDYHHPGSSCHSIVWGPNHTHTLRCDALLKHPPHYNRFGLCLKCKVYYLVMVLYVSRHML